MQATHAPSWYTKTIICINVPAAFDWKIMPINSSYDSALVRRWKVATQDCEIEHIMPKDKVNNIPNPKPVNEQANGKDKIPAPIAVFAKLEIALAKGKKLHDKRETLKAKDTKREMDRAKKF